MFRPIAVGNRLTTPYGRNFLGNLKQCAQSDQRVDPQIGGKGVDIGLTWVSRERPVVGETSRTADGQYLLSLSPLIKRAIDSKGSLAG